MFIYYIPYTHIYERKSFVLSVILMSVFDRLSETIRNVIGILYNCALVIVFKTLYQGRQYFVASGRMVTSRPGRRPRRSWC